MKKLFLTILFLCAVVPLANATQYYIDCAGNNSNAGTSSGAPWADFNTNTSGKNFLQPGDIVNFKTDCTFTGAASQVWIYSKGTALSHITLQTYGGGADPIFDSSVDPAVDVPGWTGWTLNSARHTFTVTAANATAGAVYSNNGNNFTVVSTITGGTTLVTSGTGAPTASGTLTFVSGTGDASITFASQVTSANVYVSNVTIPWGTNTITIDGTSGLKKFNPANQTLATLTSVAGQGMFFEPSCGFSQGTTCPANQLLYVRLLDDTDPNGHTIRFGRYGNGSADGHARGQFAVYDSTEKYIDINHMQIVGSNTQGFTSGAPYVNFYNCTSFASAREGWYLVKNAVQNATGAKYNTINSSTASWSAANFGQQITIESAYVNLIDVISKNGWMAGIDWLDYNSSTDASNGRCIRCIAHDNGQRAWQQDPNGFDPNGIYIDGGHNIQIIDSVVYASDTRFSTANNANGLYGISLQTEHPSTKPILNVDVINCLIYGINFLDLQTGAINCSGTACNVNDNIRIIGNTFGAGGFELVGFSAFQRDFTKLGLFMYNNIFDNMGGSSTGGRPSYTVHNVHSDYNLFHTHNITDKYVWDVTFATPSLTIAAWNALSGQDAHSLWADPVFTGSGSVGEIVQTKHLSAIASGQGSDSPGLAFATPNYLGTQYVYTSIGSVRTDAVVDNVLAPAAGYHYGAVYQSSTFPSTQSGTDYF